MIPPLPRVARHLPRKRGRKGEGQTIVSSPACGGGVVPAFSGKDGGGNVSRSVVAAVVLTLLSPAIANAAAYEEPLFNADLVALCEARDAAKQRLCTTYLSGFAEGYIWNSKDRCNAPSVETLRREYLAAIARDATLKRDPSGNLLFALMQRLTGTRCK
jgi:hypothetical protein